MAGEAKTHSSQSVIRRSHELTKNAQRVVLTDAHGGLITDGNYTVKMAYSGTNLQYLGKAQIGSATSASEWQIQKFTYDGSDNLTDIQWADATDDFTKVWDDRATYTYS